ncbi:MAG: hypothetical protein QOJ19_3636 [Acidimicrobiia bacterium]|nr:hypothetical protein [Acidimicrobiia bacterium]
MERSDDHCLRFVSGYGLVRRLDSGVLGASEFLRLRNVGEPAGASSGSNPPMPSKPKAALEPTAGPRTHGRASNPRPRLEPTAAPRTRLRGRAPGPCHQWQPGNRFVARRQPPAFHQGRRLGGRPLTGRYLHSPSLHSPAALPARDLGQWPPAIATGFITGQSAMQPRRRSPGPSPGMSSAANASRGGTNAQGTRPTEPSPNRPNCAGREAPANHREPSAHRDGAEPILGRSRSGNSQLMRSFCSAGASR